MLTKQALQEFKEIWKAEIGEDISDDFALEKATKLLTLFDAIYKPIKKELNNNYENQLRRNKD